ncbi:MAG: phosphomannomutase/phosphoglucomutase [Nitrospinae bacterium]|nr:phosphomannomutase/phosphoglucomutase [Nitrospinota bacterium]
MAEKANQYIFREYDIRGEVEKDLTPGVVENLGRAFGSRVARSGGKKVSIGRDVRLSSDALFSHLSKGICSTGCDVIDVGAVPTPVLYYSQFLLGVDSAIMITGSHNPPEFNGFKLLMNKEGVWGREIQLLAKEMEAADFAKGNGSISKADVTNPYIEMVQGKIKLSRKIKMVIDSGNGCGGLVAPRLFKEMGCDVVELFSEPNGLFPNHHPDPTVLKNMTALRAEVVAKKAEIGIGYDGDADRIGIVDELGNLLYGDQALMIFAKDMLGRRKGSKVIFDVKCTSNLPDYVKKFGGVPIMSATGHSIIKNRMHEERAELAGEMSAHIFFAEDYFGYDDAIFATARMLKILDDARVPVSQFLSDVPHMFSTPEIRVDCPDDKKFGIVTELVEYYRGKYEVMDMDGVRVDFGGGWGLIRASNTQPVLVLRFEAKKSDDLERYKREVHEKLRTFGPLSALAPF